MRNIYKPVQALYSHLPVLQYLHGTVAVRVYKLNIDILQKFWVHAPLHYKKNNNFVILGRVFVYIGISDTGRHSK